MVSAPLLISGGMAAAGLGSLLRGKRKGKSRYGQQMGEALSRFEELKPPSPEELKYQLEELVSQGELRPEEARVILMERTALEDVPTVDIGLEAELAALEKLRSLAEREGLTARDRAMMADIQERIGRERRGEREAIAQTAAQRGLLGSGLELASQLLSSQEAASRAHREGLGLAALAEERALQALRDMANVGASVSEKKYGRAARLAEAKDLIERFNILNRQNIERANIEARNRAMAANLAEKQRIAEANIMARNLQKAREADLIRQAYEDKLNLARMKAGIISQQAAQEEESRRRKEDWYRQLGGSLIGGAGQILASSLGRFGRR